MTSEAGEHELTCLVEIPRGSRNKYEWDDARGALRLDRRLFSSVVYPGDYGFIEGTLTDNGRRLDALILVSEPTFPGCIVDVRPVGLFRMRDETGIDDKVLCVPTRDLDWREVRELEDVPELIRQEIAHFFSIYKDLEPERVTAVEGWADRSAAEEEIAICSRRYADQPTHAG